MPTYRNYRSLRYVMSSEQKQVSCVHTLWYLFFESLSLVVSLLMDHNFIGTTANRIHPPPCPTPPPFTTTKEEQYSLAFCVFSPLIIMVLVTNQGQIYHLLSSFMPYLWLLNIVLTSHDVMNQSLRQSLAIIGQCMSQSLTRDW